MTVLSVVGLVAALALQIAGPSDLFHQTQPRTLAYTADVLLHGHWVLPREQGLLPATKPPLYNWLAAPFVGLLGFDSELAHKMPSVLALIACWGLTMHLGRRAWGPSETHGAVMGGLASLMLVATFTIYKLGYLARPDMLLTLWFLVAWWSSTAILAGQDLGRLPLRFIFWSAIALAWLTKGPVAILPLAYALVAARVVCGRWRAAGALGWWWGLPLSLAPFAAWIIAAYDINPDHVRDTLWRDEFFRRIVGEGPETDDEGPIGILTGVYKMPYYFIVRGAPWSVAALAGMALLWIGRREAGLRAGEGWLRAAALWIIVVLAFFTLSAGKRADYIASVYPASSILAAWAILRSAGSMKQAVWSGALAAGIAIAALGSTDWLEWSSPMPRGYGRSVNAFARRANEITSAEALPIAFWRIPDTHLPTFLGANEPHSTENLLRVLRRNSLLWLVAGERTLEESAGGIDLERQRFIDRFKLTLTPVLSSRDVAGGELWPRQVTLYRVAGKARRQRSSD